MAELRMRVRMLPSWRRPAMVVGCYLGLFAVLDVVALRFVTGPEVSIWFLPAGLDLVLLLVFGLRYWPALFAAGLVHDLVSDAPVSTLESFLFELAIAVSVCTTAAVLLRAVKIDPRLTRLRDVVWFVALGAVVGPLIGQALRNGVGVAVGLTTPGHWPVATLYSWAGAATGVAVVAPALLIVLRRLPDVWRPPPPAEPLASPPPERSRAQMFAELLAQLTVAAAALAIAYGPQARRHLDYAYLIYVPLAWVSVRQGFERTVGFVVLLNVGAAVIVVARAGELDAFALQFGLLTLSLVGLLIGAVLTERRQVAAQSRHDALHDELTALPNRTLFFDRLAQAHHRQRRQPDHRFAVLLVDLDRFKQVNESLGHLGGDELLRAVAQRMSTSLRPGDSVARFGGDEFMLLLDDVGGTAGAEQAAQRLLDGMAVPITVDGQELRVSASVGVAIAEEAQTEPEELLRRADVAVRRAKAQGRDRVVVFDPGTDGDGRDLLRLHHDLRQALTKEQLEVHYQPIVALPDREVRGVEALVRWNDPERGWVDPGFTVSVAESIGVVGDLGDLVLRTACRQVREWQLQGHPGLTVAVNVCASQLADGNFVSRVLQVVSDSGLSPKALQLELTETGLLRPTPPVVASLTSLAAEGVTFALDDFGTGYSTLTNLVGFPVTALKIDRSFTRNVPGDPNTAAVVRAVLALAESLHLDVVAEGVEDQEQLEFLQALGCPKAQGFLFGPALPATSLFQPARSGE